ncbi:MAG: adenylate/guanylate cyclase domain-containing protein [Mesorhizobium sp.]
MGQTWSRSLQFLLGTSMVALIILVSAALAGFSYYRARNAAIEDAKAQMTTFSDQLIDRFSVISGQTVGFVGLIASIPNAFLVPPPDRLNDKAALLREFIRRSPQLDGAYAGYPDGSFFHVINLRSEGWRRALAAPHNAVLAIRAIAPNDSGESVQHLSFEDSTEAIIKSVPARTTNYDPRVRPWYQAALDTAGTVSIGPYEMATTGKLGMTLAEAHKGDPKIVIGADIVLDTITDFLSAQRLSPDTVAFMVDGSGNLIIHSNRGVMARIVAGKAEADSVNSPETDAFIRSLKFNPEANLVDVGDRTFLVASKPVASAVLLKGQRVVVAAPLDELMAPANRALVQGLAISAVVVAVAVALALLLSHLITKSLEQLTESANRLQNLDFTTPVEVPSHVAEISSLGKAMNRARDAIFTFALYVPKEFVKKSVQAGYFTGRSAKREEVTALFTDIYDFTTISEGHSPEDVVAMLSEYFDILDEAVNAHHGSIIQFLGDSIFAMWNAPIPDADHAEHACRAALAAEQSLAHFNEAQRAKGLPEFRTRFGIHTGQAVVGSVGARERLQYTAMGDTINVASRLEGMNKVYHSTILASAAVKQACEHTIEFRPRGAGQAKGRAAALELYEVIRVRAAPQAIDKEKQTVSS